MYNRYHLVLAVGAFIIDERKRLLIVKKSEKEQIDAGLWTVPGGKIYPKEPILEGLRREIREEVGLEIKKVNWIGEDVFPVGDFMFHAEHFLCEPKTTRVKLESQLSEYKWIGSPSELKPLPFPVKIEQRIVEIFTQLI